MEPTLELFASSYLSQVRYCRESHLLGTGAPSLLREIQRTCTKQQEKCIHWTFVDPVGVHAYVVQQVKIQDRFQLSKINSSILIICYPVWHGRCHQFTLTTELLLMKQNKCYSASEPAPMAQRIPCSPDFSRLLVPYYQNPRRNKTGDKYFIWSCVKAIKLLLLSPTQVIIFLS